MVQDRDDRDKVKFHNDCKINNNRNNCAVARKSSDSDFKTAQKIFRVDTEENADFD